MRVLFVIFDAFLAMIEAASSMITSLRRDAHGYLNHHPLLKFIWQTIKSISIIAAFCILTRKFPQQPADRFWIVLYLSPIIVIAIIAGLTILGRRYGASAVFSIFAAISVLTFGQYLLLSVDARRAERYAFPRTQTIDPSIRLLDLSDLMKACESACIEVLAKTNYSVIVDDAIYVKAGREQCSSDENQRSHLDFLKAGYAATCAISLKRDRSRDEPVVSISQGSYPFPSFRGVVLELKERSNQSEHTLARWVDGSVYPSNGWFGFVGLDSIQAGSRASEGQVLSDALSVAIVGFGVTGNDDLHVLLDELDLLLAVPELSRDVISAYRPLVNKKGEHQDAMLQARIERLLHDPRQLWNLAGLQLTSYSWELDFDAIEVQIRALANSSDPRLRNEATYTLERYIR